VHEEWFGALTAALAGFLFCFPIRRTGSLWFVIGLHAAWDYAQSFVFGVADSGMITQGHLLNTAPAGSRWISGGAIGPEGSLLCIFVLAVIFVTFGVARAVSPISSRPLSTPPAALPSDPMSQS
jgi:membrane protease YdiL (CAAX protease family)